jgi:hypothetical protein
MGKGEGRKGGGTVGQCGLCLYKVSGNSTSITEVMPNHNSDMNTSSIISACVDMDLGTEDGHN